MPQGIINQFETVDAEEQHHRQIVIATFSLGGCKEQPVSKQRAVGQSGQQIMQHHMRDLVSQLFVLGDIGAAAPASQKDTVFINDRAAGVAHPAGIASFGDDAVFQLFIVAVDLLPAFTP